jgi:hypothetical protein
VNGLDRWIEGEPRVDDDECDCADRAPPGEYWVCPKCGAEWFPDEDEETKE